jgi:uncharacterized repeat protein (TIGR03803 family)
MLRLQLILQLYVSSKLFTNLNLLKKMYNQNLPAKARAILLLLSLLCSNSIFTQGIYQFWGTTNYGGPDYTGTIFSTDTNGANLKGQYAFTYKNDGAFPSGNMAMFNNKLYGLAVTYDRASPLLYEYDPATGEYVVKARPGFGNAFLGSLIVYNGQFYGISSTGGDAAAGFLFKYDPATASFAKLFDFNTATGINPSDVLSVYNDKLYGTASGGANNGGVFFEFDPLTNVYIKKMEVAPGGLLPTGILTAYNGRLYGMTGSGGTAFGSLFEYDPATNLVINKTVFTGSNGAVLAYSNGLLLVNDKLWGTTKDGGVNNGGVLFRYDPVTALYTKQFDFAQQDGINPTGIPGTNGNNIVGVTSNGGLHNNGVLFEYDIVQNTYTRKKDLDTTDGSAPFNSFVALNGSLYGNASAGGRTNAGTIFRYNTAADAFSVAVEFATSNGRYPSSSLTYFNKCLYGLTLKGGTVDSGTLFRYDLSTKTSTVEFNFNRSVGSRPLGDLIESNGKLYGTAGQGGIYNRGVIFSYDPINKVYAKLYDFDSVNGGNEVKTYFELMYNSAPMLLYNNKFYGTTHYGGSNNAGVLFQFDPVSGAYSKKIDFDPVTGKEPSGILTLLNGKLYGLTATGGSGDAGVLFEYDPLTNIYANRVDFTLPDNLGPTSDRISQSGLTVFNNKLYGASFLGGDNALGFLFEYDPSTGVYTKKLDFNTSSGTTPTSRLLLRNNLLYGLSYDGGVNDNGVVFEYNPQTNTYRSTADFDDVSNGTGPVGNVLISIPAAIAEGNLNSCMPLPVAVINNSNNTRWQPVTDVFGNAVAEINPNGNNLGIVNASLYVQQNPVRIAGGLRYLNRSVNITVQNQPLAGQPVDIRLYIRKAELDDLISTPNSGVNSINDLAGYKTENPCSNTIGANAVKLISTAAEWGSNYVLNTQVSSFSTFHFSAVNAALPLTILRFTANKKSDQQNQLNWQTGNEINTDYFGVERSADAIHFTTVGEKAAAGHSSTITNYSFVDNFKGGGNVYYRLKMVDRDAAFTYSKIVKIAGNNSFGFHIVPNPVQNSLNLEGTGHINHLEIIDVAGKTVRQYTSAATNQYDISNLQKGVYMLRLVSARETVMIRFVKL